MTQEKRQVVPCEVTPKKNVGVLPCSGACNVGMLTTRTVIELVDKQDNINFVCALGLPLGIAGMINNAKKSDVYIALNGCEVKCATKALQAVDIPIDAEIIVTQDLGLGKNKNLRQSEGLDDLAEATQAVIDNLL